MAFLIYIYFLLYLLCSLSFADNCTLLSDLEEALYTTDANGRRLNEVFFPPRNPTSRYISVIYTFLDEDNLDDGCNVTYFWAAGGFLLIQPPSIFELTSLLFSYPSNSITDVNLKLPYDCRNLINTENNTCNCFGHEGELLDILTQQIMQYSKFNEKSQIIRDETSTAQSICKEDLENDHYGDVNTTFYLSFTIIVLPIVSAGVTTATFWTNIAFFEHQFDYVRLPDFYSLIITGIYLTGYILILDGIAVIFYYTGHHEYHYLQFKNGLFSLQLLIVTLAIETAFLAVGLLQLILLCLTLCQKCKRYEKCKRLLKKLVAFNFLIIPFVFVSCHIGYIFAAWLTEPSKTTSVVILALSIIFFSFIMCRFLYMTIMRIFKKCARYCCNSIIAVKFWTFVLTFLFGFVGVVTIGIFVAGFYLLPLPTVGLVDYLENIVNISFLILTALVTYKIITIHETDLNKFAKKFNKAYNDQKRLTGKNLRQRSKEGLKVFSTFQAQLCLDKINVIPDQMYKKVVLKLENGSLKVKIPDQTSTADIRVPIVKVYLYIATFPGFRKKYETTLENAYVEFEILPAIGHSKMFTFLLEEATVCITHVEDSIDCTASEIHFNISDAGVQVSRRYYHEHHYQKQDLLGGENLTLSFCPPGMRMIHSDLVNEVENVCFLENLLTIKRTSNSEILERVLLPLSSMDIDIQENLNHQYHLKIRNGEEVLYTVIPEKEVTLETYGNPILLVYETLVQSITIKTEIQNEKRCIKIIDGRVDSDDDHLLFLMPDEILSQPNLPLTIKLKFNDQIFTSGFERVYIKGDLYDMRKGDMITIQLQFPETATTQQQVSEAVTTQLLIPETATTNDIKVKFFTKRWEKFYELTNYGIPVNFTDVTGTLSIAQTIESVTLQRNKKLTAVFANGSQLVLPAERDPQSSTVNKSKFRLETVESSSSSLLCFHNYNIGDIVEDDIGNTGILLGKFVSRLEHRNN